MKILMNQNIPLYVCLLLTKKKKGITANITIPISKQPNGKSWLLVSFISKVKRMKVKLHEY
jgi:hypothetical protein